MAREQGEQVRPTGRESPFRDDEMIVSKTDLKGRSSPAPTTSSCASPASAPRGSSAGQPHSIIRHPDMPRAVFKLLWDTLEAKGEIFAYVLNLAKNGDHYWVFAHVTPSFDAKGAVIGYHSNRRKPDAAAVAEDRADLQEPARRGAASRSGPQDRHEQGLRSI